MRIPTTTQLAASLALALAASVAVAQTATRAGTAIGSGTAANAGLGTANSVRGPQNDNPTRTSVPGGPAVEGQSNVDTSGTGPASFGPGGSFANDSGNSALGRSPGMTSSGTAAGNSSRGLGVGSGDLGTDNASDSIGPGGSDTDPSLVPGGGAIVDANGQRLPGAGNGASVTAAPSQGSLTVLTTPTLDATVRRAQAREDARRASGDEPRVIGIAPRTDADLTHQMPDDRIIRY